MRLHSATFPGHYYEQLELIGEGGQGTILLVLLREKSTEMNKGIYACKIIYEHYLRERNEE